MAISFNYSAQTPHLSQPLVVGQQLVQDVCGLDVWVGLPPRLHHVRAEVEQLVLLVVETVVQLRQTAAAGTHGEVLGNIDSFIIQFKRITAPARD